VTAGGENRLMGSFIVCPLHEMSLGWSNQE